MSRLARTTKTQKEFILNYLEENRALLGGKMNPIHLPHIQKLWESLAEGLNKIGPKKNVRQWKDTIGDIKTTVKRRARDVKYGFTGTGGGTPAKPLKEFEERFLALLSTLVIDGADLVEAGAAVPAQSAIQNDPILPNEAVAIVTNVPDEIAITREINERGIIVDDHETAPQEQPKKIKPTPKKIKPAINRTTRVHAALNAHDKNLARLASSNIAIARAINNLARAINTCAKKL